MSGHSEHRDPDELSVPEITPTQREEAERRLLAHESNPREYASWEEIKRRLESGQ